MRQRVFLVAGLLLVGALTALFVEMREGAAPPHVPAAQGEHADEVPGPGLHGRTPPRKAAPLADGTTESAGKTARITGRVLLPGGGPAAHASIRYADSTGGWSVAATDAEGRFALEREDGPCPPIVATAPHCGYGVAPGPHLEAGETRDVGTLQLVEGRVLAGQVVDAEGTPFADVDVSLWTEVQPTPAGWSTMWPADPDCSWGKTDEEGRFAFQRLPPGEYWVRAHAHDGPGGERVREHVPAGTTSLRIVLAREDDEPEAGVTFRVIAMGPDGRPIPEFDADLTAHALEMRGFGSAEEPAELTIEDARPPYRILVYDPRGENGEALGYAPVLLDDVAPRRAPYVFRMEEPGRTIRGRIEWDGAPRAWTVGAWGDLAADGRSVVDQVHVLPMLPDFWIQARSDASGAFEIRGLPPGRVVLALGLNDRKAGCIRGGKRVVETGTNGVVLEIRPAGTLDLVVRSPAGSFIDRAAIRLQERHGAGAWLRDRKTVDMAPATGATWQVGGLAPDRSFRVVAEGTWKGAHVGRAVLERVFPRKAPYVLELEPGPQVSGRVVTPDGAGVADAAVRLHDPEGGSWRRLLSTPGRELGVVYTDTQGRFTIRAPRAGRFFVAAVAPGLTPLPAPPLVEDGARDVQVVLRPCYSLRGRIHAASGETLPELLLTALPVTEGARLWRESDLMGDGFFDIPDLSAGPYRVVAWPKMEDDDRYVLSSPVEAGTSGLALDVRRGGILEGRVVTEQGEGVPWADVRIEGSWTRRQGGAGENGQYRFGGLPPGTYVLRASTLIGGGATADVTISRGRNTADIVLPLP